MNTDTHCEISNEGGGCDFLRGVEPYRRDVVVGDGFEVVHVTLGKLMPWRAGFVRVEEYFNGTNAQCVSSGLAHSPVTPSKGARILEVVFCMAG